MDSNRRHLKTPLSPSHLQSFLTSKNDLSQKKAVKYLASIMEETHQFFAKTPSSPSSSDSHLKTFYEISQEPTELLSYEEIQKIIEATYGERIDTLFAEFNHQGIPTSLGQVHKAKLKSGEMVAVKVQYPHLKKAVHTHLEAFHLVPYTEAAKGLENSLNEYDKALQESIDGELNFLNESIQQEQFFQNSQNLSSIYIPKVFQKLSKSHLLIQEWVEGDSFSEVITSWSPEEKKVLAKILLQSFFQQVFQLGLVQIDNHPDNFIFNRSQSGQPRVTFLDFGRCSSFSHRFRMGLMKLIYSAVKRTNEDPFPYLLALGFKRSKIEKIYPRLPLLINAFFEPLLSEEPFSLNSWNLEKKIDRILKDDQWWFRVAGCTDFFLLAKSFQGVKKLIESLDVTFSWREVFLQSTLPLFPQMNEFTIRDFIPTPYTFKAIAKYLKFEVSEWRRDKEILVLPIESIYNFQEVTPPEILEKIGECNVDINAVIEKFILGGGFPQEFFFWEKPYYTKIRVWAD